MVTITDTAYGVVGVWSIRIVEVIWIMLESNPALVSHYNRRPAATSGLERLQITHFHSSIPLLRAQGPSLLHTMDAYENGSVAGSRRPHT
jgi:hypothetical protein